MIKIQKNPREVTKRFRCSYCDCEFTAEYGDTKNFAFSHIIYCPICGKTMEWQYGEDMLMNDTIVEEHNNE